MRIQILILEFKWLRAIMKTTESPVIVLPLLLKLVLLLRKKLRRVCRKGVYRSLEFVNHPPVGLIGQLHDDDI